MTDKQTISTDKLPHSEYTYNNKYCNINQATILQNQNNSNSSTYRYILSIKRTKFPISYCTDASGGGEKYTVIQE